MSVQICIIKIAGYGPWTLELGSDREHRLQSLQASLYGALQDEFSAHSGLVFQNRSDELFALTNSISTADHVDILDRVRARFSDITLDGALACASNALEASRIAHAARSEGGPIRGSACEGAGDVVILHMDIDGLSSRHASTSPYDVTLAVYRLYSQMAEFFIRRNSLAFFMGGDNFMVISDARTAHDDAAVFLDNVARSGITLNCGIGKGDTARSAASNATRSLDDIRKMRKENSNVPRVHEMT